MSVPEEEQVKEKKAVKDTTDLPAQKKANEHQTALKYVEQSVKKTPRNEMPAQK